MKQTRNEYVSPVSPEGDIFTYADILCTSIVVEGIIDNNQTEEW